MASETELIKKIDFFSELDDKIIKKIAEVCIEREYTTGDYVVTQGETGLGLFFITSGKVNVEVDSGGSKTVVAQLKDEDCFGELSIIDNKPRSANVICAEDTRCLLLTRDSFSKLINKYPEISMQMAKALAARLRVTTGKITQQSGAGTAPTAASAPAASAASAAQTAAPTAAAASASAPPAAEAAPASSNGASTKDKIKGSLVEAFSKLYTLKAMTRFSVALVGCPVRVQAEVKPSETAHDAVGEVKLVVFPTSKRQAIRIEATGNGEFSAVVLRPASTHSGALSITHFEGQITRNDCLRLNVPPGSDSRIRLRRES